MLAETSFARGLLRSLHLGVPFLWVPDALQHGGGPGFVRRVHIGSVLLLLLHRRPGRWLQLPLWHGLWHHGRLLRVLGLPGNLYGVLRHLLSHIGGPAMARTGGGPWMKIWKETVIVVSLNSAERGKRVCLCVWEWEWLLACVPPSKPAQHRLEVILHLWTG